MVEFFIFSSTVFMFSSFLGHSNYHFKGLSVNANIQMCGSNSSVFLLFNHVALSLQMSQLFILSARHCVEKFYRL